MVPLLHLETVTKRFGGVRALDRVTLTLFSEQSVGLLGPPGAGKSTLLQVIAGALRPTSGRRTVLTAGPPPLTVDDPAPPLPPRPPDRALVIATASVSLAHQCCDRVILLADGRVRADRPAADLAPLLEHEHYRIRIRGALDPRRAAAWFDGLQCRLLGAETVLTGPVPDQTALHGLLMRIRDLGLPLLEVIRVEPDLTQIYS